MGWGINDWQTTQFSGRLLPTRSSSLEIVHLRVRVGLNPLALRRLRYLSARRDEAWHREEQHGDELGDGGQGIPQVRVVLLR